MVLHRTVQQHHTKICASEAPIVQDIRVASATYQKAYQETITTLQTRKVCRITSVVTNYSMKALAQLKQITLMVEHMNESSLLNN